MAIANVGLVDTATAWLFKSSITHPMHAFKKVTIPRPSRSLRRQLCRIAVQQSPPQASDLWPKLLIQMDNLVLSMFLLLLLLLLPLLLLADPFPE